MMGSSKKSAKSKTERLQDAIRRNAGQKPLPSGASIDLGATNMPPEMMKVVATDMIDSLTTLAKSSFPEIYETWLDGALKALTHTVDADWSCQDAPAGIAALVRVLAFSDAMIGASAHEDMSGSLGDLIKAAKLSMPVPTRELNEVVAVVCLGIVLAHPVVMQMSLVRKLSKETDSVSIEVSDFPDKWGALHANIAMTWLLNVANCRSIGSVCLIGLKKPDINVDRIRRFAKDQLSKKHAEEELNKTIMRFVTPMIEESMVGGKKTIAIHVLKADLAAYLQNMLTGISDDGTDRLARRISAEVASSSASAVGLRCETVI